MRWAAATAALGLLLVLRCTPFGGEPATDDQGTSSSTSGTPSGTDASTGTSGTGGTSSSSGSSGAGTSSSGTSGSPDTMDGSTPPPVCSIHLNQSPESGVTACTPTATKDFTGRTLDESGDFELDPGVGVCSAFETPSDVDEFSFAYDAGQCVGIYFEGDGTVTVTTNGGPPVTTTTTKSSSFYVRTGLAKSTGTVKLTAGAKQPYKLVIF